jgi:hypothetical protein
MAEAEDGQPAKYKSAGYVQNVKKWRSGVPLRPAEREALPAGLPSVKLYGGFYQDARSAAHASDK